jgi:hypothetical protein
MLDSSPACAKEMAALGKTKFASLKCKGDWETSAYAMYADWSVTDDSGATLQAIWDIAMDF